MSFTSTSTGLLNTSNSTLTTSSLHQNSNQITIPTYVSSPFSLSFSWGGKSVNITLANGNDVFKLANVFIKILKSEGIEYNIKTNKNK
jgi:hypothetical protein